MKIIPAVDVMGGRVVRLFRGDPARRTIYGGDPVAAAERWQEEGADGLHAVDLDAALELGSNAEIITNIAGRLRIPVQVAGGLRDEDAAEKAAGVASRIVLGTLAFRDRRALERLRDRLGPERIVVSVDHIGGKIAVRGWQERTGVELIDAVRDFAGAGFTEFLLTDIGRDGTMEGPELGYLREACRLGVNVIASGGISGTDDVAHVREAGADGLILGRALYEGRITVQEAKARA